MNLATDKCGAHNDDKKDACKLRRSIIISLATKLEHKDAEHGFASIPFVNKNYLT